MILALRVLRSRTVRNVPLAVVVGCAVEVGLRCVPLPRIARWVGIELAVGGVGPDVGPVHLTGAEAARYRAACLVMRRWPWGANGGCLRLALTAGFLLRRRRPQLRLGATRANGRTSAHAWVVVDGAALDPTAFRYTPLTAAVPARCAAA